jgi:DNA-binding MarR family transcriptional regulator
MTQILDRLEQLGLVQRVTDPGDRRKVLAELTDKGLETAQQASASYARERRRILKSLSPEEVEKVDTAVRLLLDVLTNADVSERA